jgi:hypothetical protein
MRLSRGLCAAPTIVSWNLEVLTSECEPVPGIHVQLNILQDPFEASHQPGRDPAFVHGPRRFLLDGAPATVDVVDVAAVELDDKHASVTVADQQSLLDEALHRLAHGTAAHLEVGGQLHLADLLPGRPGPSPVHYPSAGRRAGILGAIEPLLVVMLSGIARRRCTRRRRGAPLR